MFPGGDVSAISSTNMSKGVMWVLQTEYGKLMQRSSFSSRLQHVVG